MRMGAIETDVNRLLRGHNPVVRRRCLDLRALITRLVPEAVETVHFGWKTISYGLRTRVCAIAPHTAHVNVVFHRGTELNDPDGILEGSGRSMRHVKIRAPEDVQSASLTRLIETAATHARG